MASSSTNTGAVQTDDQGQELLFRDNHIAASVYSLDTSTLTTNPKHKFSYYVRFIKTNNAATSKLTSQSSTSSANPFAALGTLAGTAADIFGNNTVKAATSIGVGALGKIFGSNSTSTSSGTSTANWSEVLGFYAKACDRPSIRFRTRTLNQYNKKRVIQTGHDFNPIRISFNDTADGAAEAMFREYYSFYYGDAKNTSSTAWASDVIASTMNQGSGGWGFRAPSVTTAEMSYFFDTIQIYIFYNGMFDRYDIVNPKIREYSCDALEYGDPSGLLSINMTFDYEGLVFAQQRQKVLDNKSLISTWGFDRGSYFSPNYSSVNSVGMSWTPSVSFNDPSADGSYSSLSQLFSPTGLASIASEFMGGNSTMLHSYNSIFPQGSLVGDIISQNRGTISQLAGNVTNPTERALGNIAGIF